MASTTESKPSRANMLWSTQVLNLGEKIIPNANLQGIGELPRAFYNNLAEIISMTLPDHLKLFHQPTVWQQNLKRSSNFNTESIAFAVYETARWPDFNLELAQAWLGKTLPGLLALTSLNSKENNLNAVNQALLSLTQQIGKKSINLLLPLCPSYDYASDGNGFYHHQSGRIIPQIGYKFAQKWPVLKQIFSPLESNGVTINWQFLTYSGQTGQIEHLSDLGKDVLEYYSGREINLFSDLQSAFQNLSELTDSKPLSMDQLFGELIIEKIDKFLSTFPKETHSSNFLRSMDQWIKQHWDIQPGWLNHYITQELKYRKTQKTLIHSQNDLLPAAIKEGLLYRSVIEFANQSNSIIIDLETDPMYMMGELEFTPGPCLVAKGYDRQKPDNPFSIRQPYNL